MEKEILHKIVETQEGPVIGKIIQGIAVFRGIPYATPPVENLRWRPPEPPLSRQKPLEAFQFGPVCIQNEALGPAPGPMSEDCLYLNIWAPETTTPAGNPVMVWIHGGGFSTGAGSMPIFDGAPLARRGVIVVTINYRMNILGFFAHPELSKESLNYCSGNYGLLDQIQALHWVRANIRAFGGNPELVTLFGESAGGASIIALMSSPLAAGLFHRAIVQSGGNTPRLLRKLAEPNGHLASAESLGRKYAKALGLTGDKGVVEKMRALPAGKLVNEWFKTIENDITGAGISGSWMINHQIIDGRVITDAPGEIFRKGLQHNVPFLCGTTLDEGTLFQFLAFLNNPDLDGYKNYMKRVLGPAANKVLDYFDARDMQTAAQAVSQLWESGFLCGARHSSRSMSLVQPNTYRYLFAMSPKFFLYMIPGIPDWKERFGCYHAAELPYVFHFMALPGMENEDKMLSDRVMDYWVRFARNGDPNGSGAIRWPRYETENEACLMLNNPITTEKNIKNKECDFMDDLEKMG